MDTLEIRIADLKSIILNCTGNHTGQELASMEEELSKLNHIIDLWNEFGDEPMNPDTECIDVDWHGFSAGTHREEIWYWFEDEFGISVAVELMGLEVQPVENKESSSLTPWYEEQWYDEDIINIMKEIGAEVTPETLKKTKELCSEYFDDKSDRNEIIKQIIEDNFMENE